MKDQLIKFINFENMSATKLADDIGVQRSSISHILSGRNKPSYDFLEKMLGKYPQLNAEWLITGKGEMYKTSSVVSKTGPEKPKTTEIYKEQDLFSSLMNNRKEDIVKNTSEPEKKEISQEKIDKNQFTSVNKIEKIVFFYSNGFFKEYNPSEFNI